MRVLLIFVFILVSKGLAAEVPKALKEGLTLAKFAGSDLVKHPTGMTFTKDGKLLVVESHNHFRPEGYEGPVNDQIIWLEDTDGDGAADKRSVFYNSDLVATMDIATHPLTGAIYVATRNEVLRLWDDNHDGVADPDRVERKLIFLDTESDYPHDGCSGITFDDLGNLIFGIGENLGSDYTLFGGGKPIVSDGGEGGNIWWSKADGTNLRRFATGFWNPFGICHAPGGYIFATDNDPGSRPPSRLHFVVYRGDYGFQYRYGRNGQHPFQSWDGELPGKLPMMHAAGEAPCDVIYHEGSLYVASWADRRIEHYPLKWNQTHFETERKVIVQGGPDFRPVAFAVAPDGALFCSDWVKSDYQLHGEGAVWRIEGWQAKSRKMPPPENRAALMRAGIEEGILEDRYWEDPWLAPAAIQGLSKLLGNDPEAFLPSSDLSHFAPRQRALILLARQKNDPEDLERLASLYLGDPDPTVQLLALKWISDEKLSASRGAVEGIAAKPPTPELFQAAITTLARLDDKPVTERDVQKLIGDRLKGKNVSPAVKRAAFRVLPDRANFLGVKDLNDIYETAETELKMDIIQTLQGHPNQELASKRIDRIVDSKKENVRVQDFGIGLKAPPAVPTDLKGRPAPDDMEGWFDWIEAIDKSGRTEVEMNDRGRIVFHQRCAMCHRVDGFGQAGGPDLSSIDERGVEHILRSVLQPGAEVAPQYEPWQLTLNDGSSRIGFLLGQKGGKSIFSDIAGNEFTLDYKDILTREQIAVSLMPEGLANLMSDDDFVFLLRYLSAPRE